MKKEGTTERKIFSTAYLMASILLLVYVFIFADAGQERIVDRVLDISEGWTTGSGDTMNISDVRTRNFEGDVVLSRELPNRIGATDSLCFDSKNVNVEVSVDGKPVYGFEAEENLTGMGYGVCFHEIGISEEDAGKTVTLTYRDSVEDSGNGAVQRMYIATSADYIRMVLMEKRWLLIFSILILFFGLIPILIFLFIPDRGSMPFNIFALGVLAVIMGVWSLVDTNVIQLLSGHVYGARVISKLAVFFVGYPLCSFFTSLTKKKRPIYRKITFVTFLSILFLILASRFIGGVDMSFSFVRFLGAYCVVVGVLLVVIGYDDSLQCRKTGQKSEILKFAPGFIVFLVFGGVDMLSYLLHINKGDSYGTFARLGMAFFIGMVLYRFLQWWTGDQAAVERDRFVNRALQFAVTSGSPEESISNLLEFLGKEFSAKRAYIFEERPDGSFHGTYEWFAEGLEPRHPATLELPAEGLSERLEKAFAGKCIVVEEPEKCEQEMPLLYAAMKEASVTTFVAGPIETQGELTGFVVVDDAPAELLQEIADVMGVISYFFTQFVIQREEQKRLVYYSCYDVVSGAKNRSSYKDFTEMKLDLSQAFGYVICEIDELKRVNDTLGHDAGDRIVGMVARELMDVFGDDNVFRISAEEFVAFGFEGDETFFRNDVSRVKRGCLEQDCRVTMGAVYCANGTTGLRKVRIHAKELMRVEH